MDQKLTCELCGSTDFYKSTGLYFCSECQTQTQELREHVDESQYQAEEVDTDYPNIALNRSATSHSRRSSKSKDSTIRARLTSWECYNYILCGLVEELVEKLGVKPELRKTVLSIWFAYLKHIEVIHEDPLEPPKLPACFHSGDAEIVYGHPQTRKKRKRRKNSGSSSNTSILTMTSLSVLRGKKRKALAMAEYNALALDENTNASTNIHSLHSLGSEGAESSSMGARTLQFNRSARKTLGQIMTAAHLEAHQNDFDKELKCHKFSVREMRLPLANSDVGNVTRRTLYAILYLGLIFVRDTTQSGDLLRFIREGHLSFQFIDHFLPEDMQRDDKAFNKVKYTSNTLHYIGISTAGAKIAHAIGLSNQLPMQNLVALSSRYCKELNLPDCINEYVLKIISKLQPKLPFDKSRKQLPNYEARVACIIVFVLKLLYGLDDVTEYALSENAKKLNSKCENGTFFDYISWRNYIEYRKAVIAVHHYPSHHAMCQKSRCCPNLHSEFLQNMFNSRELENDIDPTVQDVQYLLEKLNSRLKSTNDSSAKHWEPSLTPFKDYTDSILEDNGDAKFDGMILRSEFRTHKIDFLVHPLQYYPSGTEVKHNGAATKVQLVPSVRGGSYFFSRKCLPIRFTSTPDETFTFNRNNERDYASNSNDATCEFQKEHRQRYESNLLGYKMCPNQPRLKAGKIKDTEQLVHHNPDECFWVSCISLSKGKVCTKVGYYVEEFRKLPYNFQLALCEITRLTEQSLGDTLEEYEIVENYLCQYDFSNNCQVKDGLHKKSVDGNLRDKARDRW